MKKLFIISAIAMSGLIYNTANAQIRLHFGLGFRPRAVVYAPAPVVVEQAPVDEQPATVYDQNQPAYSDSNDDYYYLPDVDAYYDITGQCYYYNDGNGWISAAYLPGAYRNYDWRNAPRYEVRASRPYLHDDVYRSRYNGRTNSQFAQNNYNPHFTGGDANGGQRSFSQPLQPNRNQAGYNQHLDNRGQGNNAEPLRKDENRSRDTRGDTEHFAQNSPQGGFANNRMTKF